MRPSYTWLLAAGAAAVAGSTSGYAADYLTIEQAKEALFPGAVLTPVAVHLNAAQRKAVESHGAGRVRNPELRAWRAPNGGWLLVDDVLGKHELITYACALTPRGEVQGVEILSYRETYGGEIRRELWRHQFVGKTAASPLQLDHDVQNISGATLSCRHVTDGLKRLLVIHQLILRHVP